MDYEKYYRIQSDGSYTIHFANKKGFSIDKIRDIFSSYGKVLSVNISGDINGLRYIRYKTLDETIRCLKSLQNSDDIRILTQKINTYRRIDQNSSNTWQTKIDNSFQKTSNIGKPFNSNFVHDEKFSSTGDKLAYNKRSFDRNNRSDRNNKPDRNNRSDVDFSDSSNSKYSYKPIIHTTKYDRREDLQISAGKHSMLPKQQDSIHEMSNIERIEKFFSTHSSSTNTYVNKDISNDNKIPALISDSEMEQKEFDTISDNSLTTGIKNMLPNTIIIPMQEVVVANIHTKYGVNYVLHLFEKYNPISATLVKTIPKTDIRYCQVYFKTVQDALAIEEEFDNFVLSGKNLIVLRKSQLIDEAMCK